MNIIETERLVLREMTYEDVPYLLKIFSDPVAMKYYPSTKTEEETREWVRWIHRCYQDHGFGLWSTFSKETSDFIGQAGLVPQVIDGQGEVEIGYHFIRSYWDQGYATEAGIGCREYGFRHLGLSRLISIIDPENIPSRRVAEKIGMKLEKKSIKWDKKVLIYAMSTPSEIIIPGYEKKWYDSFQEGYTVIE